MIPPILAGKNGFKAEAASDACHAQEAITKSIYFLFNKRSVFVVKEEGKASRGSNVNTITLLWLLRAGAGDVSLLSPGHRAYDSCGSTSTSRS